MAIPNIAMKAYANAIATGADGTKQQSNHMKTLKVDEGKDSFADAMADTIKGVNDMQTQKSQAIESFVSGENENVHELMITLQKASITMSMTNAVRGKVMEAYKELMHIQF